jgi:hypothetical protein
MQIRDGVIKIGHYGGGNENLLYVRRDFNTQELRRGIRITLDQNGSGEATGLEIDVDYNGSESRTNIEGINSSLSGSNGDLESILGYAWGGYNAIGIKGSAHDASNDAIGIYGLAEGAADDNWAGKFNGDVDVEGDLYKDGGGFKIDHPLDPSNKYLQHSFVESPDRMNVYNGNVVLNADGQAIINMPNYFEALNTEFRYQLTCIGGYAPVYISEEISGNSFSIAGGEPFMKVSWQVTGIRQDAWAKNHQIITEVEKKSSETGRYRHPELYGFGIEKHVDYEIIKDR